MFEHLDDRLPPVGLLADPAFAEVRERTRSVRRRQNIVVTTLSLSLLATGGVSGLALGGPDSVHAPIGRGPLLALGDPRSLATDLPPAQLTGSDQTSSTTCPTPLDPGHPVGFAAAAVTDPAPAGLQPAALPASSTGGDLSTTWGSAVASIAAGATGSPSVPMGGASGSGTGSGTTSGSGTGSAPHPVVGPRPTLPGPVIVPLPVPPVGTGGGVQVPIPTSPPPTTPPATTPPVETGGGGTDPGSGDPTTAPTDPPTAEPTGDPGGTGGDGTGTPTPDPTDGTSLVDQILGS